MHHITPELSENTRIAREMKVAGKTYREISEYLGKSNGYAATLLKIARLSSDGFCERCHQHSAHLAYHHVDYRTDEFKRLCRSCHAKIHIGRKRRKQVKKRIIKRRWNRRPVGTGKPSRIRIGLKTTGFASPNYDSSKALDIHKMGGKSHSKEHMREIGRRGGIATQRRDSLYRQSN